MIKHRCVDLQEDGFVLKDIQLWSDQLKKEGDLNRLSTVYTSIPNGLIEYHKIPIYLIEEGCFSVFSSDKNTEAYFKERLIKYSTVQSSVALMFKSESSDSYLVFYFDVDGGEIKSFNISFQWVMKFSNDSKDLNNIISKGKTVTDFNEHAISYRIDDNVSVFDRVLSKKKSKSLHTDTGKNNVIMPTSSIFMTNEQLSQNINKVIMSGLRLRGLINNTNQNINEKLTIKEVYQMTYKSAIFAMRKFKSNDNGSRKLVKLRDIQDIVEKLLHIYLDTEENTTSNNHSFS